MEKQIYVLGVGRNTPVVMELAEAAGYRIAGLYHYEKGREGEVLNGVEIIGSNDDLFNQASLKGLNFVLSMGNNSLRTRLADSIRSLGGIIPTLIHPTAFVSKYAIIEDGALIYPNASIQAHAMIKQDTVIAFNTVIAHNTVIERGCYIASLSLIGAYVKLCERVFVGSGAVCVSGKVPYIGADAVVGAGSVVIQPVEEKVIVIGNPAKILKRKE